MTQVVPNMHESILHLETRLNLLETSYFTGSSSSGTQTLTDPSSLLVRVQQLLSKVQSVEQEFPEIKACADAVLKIYPLLGQKSVLLKSLHDKVQQLLTKKQFITDHVTTLQNIQGLQHVINDDRFSEAEESKVQLDRIQEKLQDIVPVIQQQTKEIDDILDIYEKAVSFTTIYTLLI